MGLVLAALSLVLLGFLIRRWLVHGFDRALFLRVARTADWHWLLAGWALGVGSFVVRALRWRVMVARIRPGIRFLDILTDTIIGYTGIVLIGRACEFLRPVLIARSGGMTVASQLAIWVVERIYDTLLVFALFGYALAVMVRPEGGAGGPLAIFAWKTGGWVAATICSLCLLVLVALHFYTGRIGEALDSYQRAHPSVIAQSICRFARRALEGMHAVRGAGSVAGLLILSIAEWILVPVMYLIVFHAFPATRELTFADAAVFTGMAGIGAVFQVPGVGGGFQIACIAALREFFGVRVEEAGLVALAAWFTSFVGIVPFGLVAVVARGWSWKRLLQMSRQTGETD